MSCLCLLKIPGPFLPTLCSYRLALFSSFTLTVLFQNRLRPKFFAWGECPSSCNRISLNAKLNRILVFLTHSEVPSQTVGFPNTPSSTPSSFLLILLLNPSHAKPLPLQITKKHLSSGSNDSLRPQVLTYSLSIVDFNLSTSNLPEASRGAFLK